MEAKKLLVSQWIDRKIRIYMDQSGCKDYAKAYHKVLGDDAELRQMYAGIDTKTVKGPHIKAKRSRREVGEKLHNLTMEYMTKYDVQDYHQAYQAVLWEHEDLAREYSQS